MFDEAAEVAEDAEDAEKIFMRGIRSVLSVLSFLCSSALTPQRAAAVVVVRVVSQIG